MNSKSFLFSLKYQCDINVVELTLLIRFHGGIQQDIGMKMSNFHLTSQFLILLMENFQTEE